MSGVLGIFAPIGRILLGALFIWAGVGKILDEAQLTYVASAIEGLELGIPGTVGAWGVVALEIVGGLLVVVGLFSQLAALLLAAFCIASAVLVHAFWSIPEEQVQRIAGETVQFFKNLSIAGGLLMVTAHGPGVISLGRNRG